MKPKTNLIGRQFGRLTVTTLAPTRGHHTYWECQCACGGSTIAEASALNRGKWRSCGCLRNESSARRKPATKHGDHKTAEYRAWQNIHYRCSNPKSPSWKYYGAIGITVCKRWRKYANFIADMGRRPSAKHSIDRHPNNAGHYRPSNCRWATAKQQANNRRARK